MSRAPAGAGERDRLGGCFWGGAAIGGALVGYGVVGLLSAGNAVDLGGVGRWFAGALVFHDLLLAPIVCAAGLLITRTAPPRWRAPLRAGCFASATAIVVGWAPLNGTGRAQVPDNASIQPLDYARSLVWVLGTIWVLAIGWGVLRTRRSETYSDGQSSAVGSTEKSTAAARSPGGGESTNESAS